MKNGFLIFVIVILVIYIGLRVKQKYTRNPITRPSVVEREYRKGVPLVKQKPIENLPEFIDIPVASQKISEDSIYADIINHAKTPVLDGGSRDTNGHESTHMINADIRNSNIDKGKINGFYVLKGRGVIVQEPNIRKKDIIPYIPTILRGSRFDLYLQGQTEWDDSPLYIMDEFTAYINGSSVSVEDAKAGREIEKSDAVRADLEFSIYSVALAMAVAEKDPTYWQNNKQFRNFLIFSLRRAQKVFEEGRGYFPWPEQDKLLENLRNDPSAKGMREFIKNNLDGVWLKCSCNPRPSVVE